MHLVRLEVKCTSYERPTLCSSLHTNTLIELFSAQHTGACFFTILRNLVPAGLQTQKKTTALDTRLLLNSIKLFSQ